MHYNFARESIVGTFVGTLRRSGVLWASEVIEEAQCLCAYDTQ